VLKRIDHIGIVVQDLEAARRSFEALGMNVERIQEVPDRPVKAAFLPLGDSDVELLQPLTSDGDLAQFLEEHGEGIHHICIEVEDIQAALAAVKSRGIQLREAQPRQGASGRIAFLHPGSTHGVLIEFVEK